MGGQEVDISIVTGKHRERLEACLSSLKQAITNTSFRVFVVDNCAEFDVVSSVKKYYPTAVILKNDTPMGFAANHNQVLSSCNGDYVLVLNDDVELGEKCADIMCDFIKSNSDAGLVGPALYERKWNSIPKACGGDINSLFPPPIKICLAYLLNECGLSKITGKWIGRMGQENNGNTKAVELSFVSGACCLIRKKMLNDTGLFDEGFFMYLEDMDLGVRARKHGWRCYQAPGAKVLHYSASSFTHQTWLWIYASLKRYAYKYHSLPVRIVTFLLITQLRLIIWIKDRMRSIYGTQ